jgi:hypothetical protein
VALGKVQALQAWTETEDPPYSVWRRVERWVLGLPDTPMAVAKRTPDYGDRGPWEIRAAVVPETGGVEVVLRA